MKKLSNIWLLIVAMALGFSSCSQEKPMDVERGAELQLSTSINDLRVTEGSTWTAGDAIGVSISTITGAENVKYTAANTAANTTFTGGSIMVPATGVHEAKAYYPFTGTSGTAQPTVTFDINTNNGQPLLYASKQIADNANPVVNFAFEHKLSKINILVQDNNTTEQDVKDFKIADMVSGGTLKVADGTFTKATTKATLNLYAQTNGFFTYAVPGEELAGKKVTFTYGTEQYEATFPATASTAIEAGKYYTYTITIGATTGVELVIGDTTTGSTITGLGAGASGEMPGTPVTGGTTTTPTISGASLTGPAGAQVLNVTNAGGTFSLTLSGLEAGTVVTATDNPVSNWFSINGDVTLRVAEDQTLNIVVQENTTTEARSSVVTLTAEGMADLSFTITQAAAGTTPPTTEVEILANDFTSTLDPFTEVSVVGDYKWGASRYGAKMSGYNSATKTNHDNEDWLISPAFDLSSATSLKVAFEQAINFANDMENEQTMWYATDYNGDVKAATWVQVTIPNYPDGKSWNAVSTEVVLPDAALGNDNVVFAFKYICGTVKAATWQIKNLSVKSAGGKLVGAVTPTPTPTPTPGEGDGSEASPYSVAQAIANNENVAHKTVQIICLYH